MEARLKNSNRRFQSNIETWSNTDPKHAITLQFLDTEGYGFTQTDKGELNLVCEGRSFHDQKGAQDEADSWFLRQDLEESTLLYVYGVGLGYAFTAAKEWLKRSKKHRLIFLEDDLKVIAMLFQTPLGKEMIHHRQVELHYFRSVLDSPYVFEMLFWKFLNVSFSVAAIDLYQATKREIFEELKHKLIYDAAVKNAILDEYLKFGVAFFRNFYPNMLSLPGSYKGSGLFGQFEKIPAIICGAGPSLAKHFELLKKLDNKALIFAGGSALNALNKAGIMPHFGAGVDPNPPQYERYLSNNSFEVPFFYRSRLYHPALELIHGPRLYLNGCGGYDIPKFFEERLQIEGEELPEGHNIVNFLVGLAHALGCGPIILVGVDLAFTDDQLYAPGVVSDGAAHIESLKDAKRFDEIPLMKEDIHGNEVYTLWKWIAESKYIADYAADNPDLQLINSTEGGLGFFNVPNIPLKEVAEKQLKNEWDLKGIVHSRIQQCGMDGVTREKIQVLMDEIKESLENCRNHLHFLRKEGKEQKGLISKSDAGEVFAESGEAVLHQIELSEEVAFQYLLHHFNEAYNWVLQSEFDQMAKVTSMRRKEIKKLTIQDKKYHFLEQVLKANQLIIDWAQQEHKEPVLPVVKRSSTVSKVQKGLSDKVVIKDDRGTILSQSQFSKGLRNGETKLWYGSGVLYAIERYKKGVYDGKQEYFYEDGTPKTVAYYQEGYLLPEAILYYPDGTVKRKLPASCE